MSRVRRGGETEGGAGMKRRVLTVALFLLLSAGFHGVIALPRTFERYLAGLASERNFFRCFPRRFTRPGERLLHNGDLLLALFQAKERGFDFLMHAQDLVDAPIVFTLEALDFGQAVLDFFQRARIEMGGRH